MSIPKKGSRKIIVDGEEYIWLIRSRPTYAQDCLEGNMTAAVELKSSKGATLQITFPFLRPDAALNAIPNSVTPKVIESCIKSAISLGWQPNKAGGIYKYEHGRST